MQKLLALFSMAVLFSYCSQPAAHTSADVFNLDSVKSVIASTNAAISVAIAKGDSTGQAALYTSDACMFEAGTPICGTAALTSFFSAGYKMGVKGIKITSKNISGGKELVAEEGSYELIGDNEKVIDSGTYITLWKEENGKWKVWRDIGMTQKK
jgi:ketosteroid isomerase-like protein